MSSLDHTCLNPTSSAEKKSVASTPTITPLILYRIANANIHVILSAPHGGHTKFGAQSIEMNQRPLLPGVVTKSDLHTLDLLMLIDDYVRLHAAARPHVVAARFHRQFIDANRNARVASQVAVHPDCVVSRQLYDDYHSMITQSIEHAIGNDPHSRVLLLDLHGMKPYTDYIAVGTLNGLTYDKNLCNEAYMGFLWHLRDLLGTSILPLPGCSDFPQYSGGYTIQRHGVGSRVDAFQLEFGSFLRQVEVRRHVAAAVGEAIVRSLQPMEPFLMRIRTNPQVGWSMDGVRAVRAKLRRANCYTPRDLRATIASINITLVAQGSRRFSRGTLKVIRNALCSTEVGEAVAESGQAASINSGKLTPREFLDLHFERLWDPCTVSDMSAGACGDEDRLVLRSTVRRIFLCSQMVVHLLNRPQSEADAVQSFLQCACQNQVLHASGCAGGMKEERRKGGSTSSTSSGSSCESGSGDDNDCSLAMGFFGIFLRGLSFSCAPAKLLLPRLHCYSRGMPVASHDSENDKDNVPVPVNGFAITFADANEFNQKLRDWRIFVARCFASRALEGEGTEETRKERAIAPRFGTAAALVHLSVSAPPAPPTAAKVSRQAVEQEEDTRLGSVSMMPPSPPQPSIPPMGEDALCQVVVVYES